MNILKKAKVALAALLSVAMIASMSALAVSAAEADADAGSAVEPTGTKIEAEDVVSDINPEGRVTLNGGAAIVNDPTIVGADVSGGAFVGSLGAEAGNPDNYVQITLTAENAGEVAIDIAYITWGDRSIDIVVNEHTAINIVTPGNNSNWNGGVKTVTANVWLDAGENTVRFCNLTGWASNIDYVVVYDAAEGASQAAVDTVVADATALPEEVTDVDVLAQFEEVARKYAGLSEAQKALLTADQKTVVEGAVAALDAYNSAIEQEATDRSAAASVTGLINVIANAADKEAAVKAAREAYDALTDTQKEYISVGTLKLLTDAEAALEAGASGGDNNNNANTNGGTDADANANNGGDSDKKDESDNSTTIIVIVVVAVVVVAGVIVFVVARKKK